MIFSDLHTHTIFCDGLSTPEEMVLSAIDKGLKRIGLCMHSYIPNSFYEPFNYEKQKEFIKCVNSLKIKYADKIEVLCGLENDYFSTPTENKFDYIIGSLHLFNKGDVFLDIDRSPLHFEQAVNSLFDGDYYQMAEWYYETISNIVEKTNCDIIGHFDLITKFNINKRFFDQKHPRYINAYKKAVDKLIKFNKPFEVNTGAIARGYQNLPYPDKDIIEYIKLKGGRLILSSDAHNKDDIAFEYQTWVKLI
jgi:histidinol-phosphatase (PHP family)